MPQDAPRTLRKVIHLRHYDYGTPGAYFVTSCVHNRRQLFGSIEKDEMKKNPAGTMITKWWLKLTEKFHEIELDSHVVMPNHFHGIVIIRDTTEFPRVETGVAAAPRGRPLRMDDPRPAGARNELLFEAMEWFKTMTTNEYIRGVKSLGWTRFDGFFWQRSFHEHVIRSARAHTNIHNYIINNPLTWTADCFHPDHKPVRG